MTSIKPGVGLARLKPMMAVAFVVVRDAYHEIGAECTITSGDDGEHMVGSKHYSGEALDFRINNVAAGHCKNLSWSIQKALGPAFDVVLEPTHLHVEYDPKE